jgi:hypothetical protein
LKNQAHIDLECQAGRVSISLPPHAKPGPPMTLWNMRQNGVRVVIATCQACGHKADVNVASLPTSLSRSAPWVGLLVDHVTLGKLNRISGAGESHSDAILAVVVAAGNR